MKRTFLLVALVLITGLGVTAYLMYTHESPDNGAATPDYRMSTRDLTDAFEKDSAASRKKFTDKIVQITGEVRSLDTSGSLVLAQEGGHAEVIVAIDDRYLSLLKQTAPGSAIIIQGLVSNYNSGVSNGDDLLSGLGATVMIRAAGIRRAP